MDVQKTGALISVRRKELGMTQGDLAQKLHVSDRAVSKWERGLNLPSAEQFEPLCEALGITVLELLRGELSPAAAIPTTQAEEAVSAATELARYKERRARRWKVLGILLACALLVCGGLLAERIQEQARMDDPFVTPSIRNLSHHDMGTIVTIRKPRPSASYSESTPYARDMALSGLAINTPLEHLDDPLRLVHVPNMVIDDVHGSPTANCYFDESVAKTGMDIRVYRWRPEQQGIGVTFEDGEEIACEKDNYHGHDWVFKIETGYLYSIVLFWGESNEYFVEYAFRAVSILDE